MEQSMYEDGGGARNSSTPLKPSFILDFNQEPRSRPPMDFGLLKLSSPELEKYLMQQDGSVVTAVTPTTQILFPKCVTQEQENYARGFIDALDELHRRQGLPPHMIKKEKNDDAMFYHNNHQTHSYHNNHHHHSNSHHDNNLHNNLHTYSQSLNEISHNGLFFINTNNTTNNTTNNNTNNNNNDDIINRNKTSNLNTLQNVTNNNFIIINNNISNNKLATSSPSILQPMPSLLQLHNNNINNHNNSHFFQQSLATNLAPLGAINYNMANNINNHNNDTKNLSNNNLSNNNNNLNNNNLNNNNNNLNNNNNNLNNNNNVLLTNPDISLNENIFSKNISPSLTPYPALPPAQTLLTRSPNTKNVHQATPLDSKPFLPSNNQEFQKTNKNSQKRSAEMAKFDQNVVQNSSNLSPSSFSTTAPTEEHSNQTVPYLVPSPPSISSTGDSPSSNSPSEEMDRLEIKRARNRLAAQKCRSRKLERIAVLSERVDELKRQNSGLEVVREGVICSIEQLQQQLHQHSSCSRSLSAEEWSVEKVKDDH